MRPSVISIAALLIASTAGAQNLDAVKSLRSKLPTASKEETFEILCSIGFEFRYSYPDSTLIYCNKAYELGKEIKLASGLSKPLSFIGLAYANKGDYQNSFEYHRRSIDLSIEQNDSIELAYGYNNLGRMFYDQGDLVRSFDNLIRSKEIFQELGDKSGLAYVNRSIASVYHTQKDFEKALEMSHSAYNLRKEVGDPRMIVSSLMEIGLVHQTAGDTDSALTYFLRADSASANINDPVTRAELSIGLAEILLEEGNLQEAFNRTEQVLKTITEQTNQKMFLRATYLQARYYYEKKNYSRATALLRETLESAESTGNVLFQRDASFLLAEIYKSTNDKNRAEEYVNRYRIFSGMLENTDLARQIERLQFQVAMERKDKELEQSKLNEERNTATIAKQRAQNIALIAVVASVTSIAVVMYVNSRRRRLINYKLAQNNQELSDLNQEKNTLMNIVAHDLKAPLNRISGLASIIEIDAALSGKQKDYMKLIRDATRSGLDLITDLLDVNALEEVKDIPGKKEIDLATLLDERVKAMQVTASNKSIKLNLKVDQGLKVNTDPGYINRIVDNLLSNAVKFSPNGSEVNVAARVYKNSMILSVKDNGPGFMEEDKPYLFQKFKKLSARPTGGESSNGLGLAIVKTLVDRLKGDIRLETARGKGSEFIITLPL